MKLNHTVQYTRSVLWSQPSSLTCGGYTLAWDNNETRGTLFFNIHTPGITVAIPGPWERGPL